MSDGSARYSGVLQPTAGEPMARTTGIWSEKVLALIRAGSIDAAVGQIKVAPSLKDLKALQAALIVHRLAGRSRTLDVTVTDALEQLSAPRLHRSP